MGKLQIPSSKHQGSSKHQAPTSTQAPWCLELDASLELGAWCLVLSFGTKGGNGIGLGGAERRQERGEQTDDGENENNAREDQRVVRFRSEQQRLHQPRDGGGG